MDRNKGKVGDLCRRWFAHRAAGTLPAQKEMERQLAEAVAEDTREIEDYFPSYDLRLDWCREMVIGRGAGQRPAGGKLNEALIRSVLGMERAACGKDAACGR